MFKRLSLGWIVAVGLVPVGYGQTVDAALRSNVEHRLGEAAAKVVETGVDLYNNRRDYAGCYWLYRGALTGFLPLLQGTTAWEPVQRALRDAETRADFAARATALRAGLDAVLKLRRPSAPNSLWNRLGGEPAVSAVVHDFVARAAGNPRVDFTRGGRFPLDARGVANLERLLVEQISSVSGGPLQYTGRDMGAAHAGMDITDAQFDALAGDLVAVLKQYRVPQREADELVSAIASTRTAIVGGRADRVAADASEKPLWDRLGGEKAVRAVVHDFVARAVRNPMVDFTRGGKYPLTSEGVANLERLLVELISATSGGPLKYTGRDMKTSHQGMGITGAQFAALASDLVAVLKQYKVPPKEIDELVGIIATTQPEIVEMP